LQDFYLCFSEAKGETLNDPRCW